MTSPLRAGAPLPAEQWESVCLQTISDHCKWDIQAGDHCALARFPLMLEHGEWVRLAKWAESLTSEALSAEQELLSRPELLERLGVPRRIRKALHGACNRRMGIQAPRVMRFDFHYTTEGWKISEANSDVPGGFIEASGFTELMATHYPQTITPPNPAQSYAEALRRTLPSGALVALVYATAYTDDGQVMEYIARKLCALGIRTCLLSPAHLRWQSGRARIVCQFARGTPDLIVRFFPGEWLPNLRTRDQWSGYFNGGETPVSNPGSALLIQSKRFPLTWNHLVTSLPNWRELLPQTVDPRTVTDLGSGGWALKPVLGRVGEGVAIPRVVRETEWRRARKEAWFHPSSWVAQKRFAAVPVEAEGKSYYSCLGVFTVDGRTCGVYGRVAEKPLIDVDAQDAAVLITKAELKQ
jgi:glutathionylspermidine synthase